MKRKEYINKWKTRRRADKGPACHWHCFCEQVILDELSSGLACCKKVCNAVFPLTNWKAEIEIRKDIDNA